MQSLVFDLDGVLVDSDQHHKRTLREAAAHYGYSVQDIGTTTTIEKLVRAGVPRDEVPEIYQLKRRLYDEYMSEALQADPALSVLFMRLNKVGYRLAVCSNSNIASVRLVVGKLGIAPFLTVISSASEVNRGKPAPGVYTLTIHRLKTTPEQLVVFEDSDEGEEAARAAGARNIIRCTTKTVVKEASKWL